MSLQYKKAGVDMRAGDALVEWLKTDSTPVPHQDKIVSGIGGFASLFRASFEGYEKPCLVSCTDGVGTKVQLATRWNSYDTVAQDLVAMCVNDLICCGAQPLFFLDYYACHQLELEAAQGFLKGLKKACHEAQCALIGGETAEMSSVYQKGDFDCAGFAVGVVDEEKAWGAHRVAEGAQFVGVSSSGFHSNGFSLLQKVFEKDLDDYKEILLQPTHLYVELVQKLKAQKVEIWSASHITGGGISNLLRSIPSDQSIELKEWDIPPIFEEVQHRAKISKEELVTVFNGGLGFVLIIPPDTGEKVIKFIEEETDFHAFDLGRTVAAGAEQKIIADWLYEDTK